MRDLLSGSQKCDYYIDENLINKIRIIKEKCDLQEGGSEFYDITIDKELIKTLVLTPRYKGVKISDILTQIYPQVVTKKQSSENETATASGDIETITNFDKINPDQKKMIMADESARKKYFDWLDKQTGR